MAKQLNVSLAIKADTQQAKSALNELQKSLTKVIETKTINVNDKSIVEAKQAAMDLNKHLNAAVNTDTGKLDLGKFSSSLQKSNQTLSGLYTNLSKIGPSGQQAFLSLSKSIALADQQTLSLGNKISQLGTTLANTARWQVSSSILHSMMGAVQGAYYYAKDLNESLNNIRIVTGQSEAQMANFAKYASSAAKALSTSTMDVTKASLIYFQQGLSEEQVKARTEVTLKMANVSRQSAQEVSDQMTAIWNNFYNGSKSLEYYADVITKLGAATASSSSEIANGLQKFASVADTVGLSYEKATAALATIVAETRQSEDVVGTSLKTMLSRFQSLKLGETLEDGVDLNKYSAALETVGVKVLDANGNLRDMDGILDDLGEKWKLLGNAQQVALAQTVAGQRQYAQFIALVDNYDKVLANQSLGENSSGTLNTQQETFAEGWEAAAKRVKAALEEFYNSILDDKFFITILNGLEKVLIGVKSVVNGLGGLKGVLLLIGSIVLEKYAKEMPAFLDRMKTNFQVLTGQAEKFRQSQIGEALDKMREMGKQSNSKEIEAQISGTTKLLEMTQLLAQNRDKLSKAEIAEYENKIKQVQVYTELATAIGKEVDEINKEIAAQETALRVSMSKAGHSKYVVSGDERKQLQAELNNKKELVQNQRSYINAAQGLTDSERQSTLKSIEQSEEKINQLESQLNETVLDVINNYKTLVQQHEQQNQYLTEANNKTNDWINALGSGSQEKIASVKEQMLEFLSSAQKAGIETKDLREEIQKFDGSKEALGRIKDLLSELVNDPGWLQTGENLDAAEKKLRKLGADDAALIKLENAVRSGTPAWKAYQQAVEEATGAVDKQVHHSGSLSESIGKIASGITRAISTIRAAQNLGSIWADKDVENGEKLLSTASSLAMIIPQIVSIGSSIGGPLGFAVGAALALFNIFQSIFSYQKKIREEEEKAHQKELERTVDQAKKAGDLLESWSDQSQSMDNLIKKYYDLKEAAGEYEETQKDIIDSVPDLIKKYDELADTLGLTKEQLAQYKQLKAALQSAADFGNTGLIEQAKHDLDVFTGKLAEAQALAGYKASTELLTKESSVLGFSYQQLKYDRNGEVISTDPLADSADATNALYKDILSKYFNFSTDNSNREGFNLTGVQVVQHYKDFENILEEMESKATEENKLDELEDDETYRTIRNIVAKLQDKYGSVEEAKKTYQQWAVSNAALGLTEKSTSISSYAEYTDYKEKLEGALAQTEGIEQEEVSAIADEWLRAQTALSEYTKLEGKFKGYTQYYGQELGNWIKQAYTDLTPEQKKLFLELDINDITSQEALEAVLDKLQKEADLQPIKVQMTAVDSAKSKLKEKGMKAEDWEAINGLIDWEKAGIEFTEFMSLTYDQQVAFLDKYEKSLTKAFTQGIGTGLVEAQKHLEEVKGVKDRNKSVAEVRTEWGKAVADQDWLSTVDSNAYGAVIDSINSYYQQLMNGAQARENAVKDQEEYVKWLENEAAIATRLTQARILEADSLSALNAALKEAKENGFENLEDTEAQALINIAGQYDNCTEEVLNLNSALASGSDILRENAEQELRNAIQIGEMAKSLDLSAESIENQAKVIQDSNKALNDQADTASRIAVLNQSMNKGLTTLSKNWETWKKTLTETDKKSAEYADTVLELKDSLAQLLGVTNKDFIPDGFLELPDTMELIEKAANGDVEAINKLGVSMAKASVEAMNWSEGMFVLRGKDRASPTEVFESTFDTMKQRVLAGIQELENGIANGSIKAGESVTSMGEDWATALNVMAESTGMSVEQMQSLLNELGVEAEVTSIFKPQKVQVPRYITETRQVKEVSDKWEQATETRTYLSGIDTIEGGIEVAQINVGKNKGKKPTVTYAGRASVSPSALSSSSSSGGGGSSKSLKDYKDQQDELERYHVIKKQLDDLSRSYDRLSKAKDRSFGAQRLKYLKEENAVLQDQIKLQSEYIDQIHSNAEKDLSNLIYGKNNAFSYQGQMHAVQGLSHYGITPQLDSNNNILNWYQIKEAALAEYNAAVEAYNAGTMTEEAFALAEKQYEEFNKLIEQYEESNELLQDAIDKRQELIYEWQDNNFEAITYELEVKLIVNEGRMKWLQYQLKKIGDSVYHASEAISNLFSLTAEDQSDIIGKKIEDYTNTFNQLNEAWNTFDEFGNRSISQKDYIDGLQQVRDGLYEQLEAWMAIDEQMEHYYSDTLDKVDEELRKIFDRMRHNVDIIDHLQKVLELTGRKEDYEMMGKLLTANMDQNKAIYESSKEAYEMYQRQREAAEKEYEDALAHGGKELQEIAKNNFEAAVQKANEAEAQMYQDLETFLESCNAVIQNELDRTKAAIESMYTNGKGWDYLNSILDISERIGDKYLTKTNQIYETNKLLRQIRQDIDKTDNLMAKQKLKNFTNEINSLQKINKLSKNQLEIAQAQYEVLKAQIALEEAQNAKSTVRLQRDSEGNYGYVYTADQDKIGEAEQNLANAQNDLYNIALRQENDTAKEIMSINQERTEALAELWRQFYVDKTLSEEEYNEKVVETNKKYNELLEAATKDSLTARELLTQLSVTNENDSWTHEYEDLISKGYAYIEAQDEFWTLGFGSITGKREDWFSQENPAWEAFYNGIMDLSRETQETWNEELQKMRDNTEDALQKFDEIVGVDPETGVRGSLLNLEKKIADVTAETARLKDSLSGSDGLISTLEKEADEVRETTLAWGEYYDYLNATVIPEVERLIQEIQELIEWASENTYSEHVIETKYVTSGDVPGSAAPSAPAAGGGGGGGTGGTGPGANDGSRHVRVEIDPDIGPGADLSTGIGIIDDPKKRKILQYASGGYTGSWTGGSDLANGRLALLHQKELVLNEQDTENMLQTVQFVRQISGAIDLRAGSRAYTPGFKAPVYQMGDSGFEQQVTIHAEFPNAVNHSEIEEAFDNLINRASQYVNRPVNYLY